MENQKEKKFNYAYVIYAVSFIMIFMGLGFGHNVRSLFIQPVCDGVGVSRGIFALSDSIRFVITALMNLSFGLVVAKLGQRIMIAIGFAAMTAGLFIYSFAPSIYVYWVGAVLLGVGLSFTTTTMIGSIMNSWCDKNKGTVTGLILSASGIGGAVATQIVSPVVESGADGYRKAYQLCAIVVLITGIIVVLLYKNRGQAVSNKKKSRYVGWEGIEFSEASKKPYFYICLICIFFTGFALQGMTGTSTQHMKDVFNDPVYVTNILSSHLLILTASKFLTGVLYDKFGVKITFIICALSSVAALMLLAFMNNDPVGKGFAVAYAFISCVGCPLETIMLPIFASEFFGPKSFDKAIGLLTGLNVAGYAAGSFVIGLICDLAGGYAKGYFIYGLIMVMVFFLMLYVIRAARKERLKSE